MIQLLYKCKLQITVSQNNFRIILRMPCMIVCKIPLLARLYARYLCSRDALGLKAEPMQPVGQARRATIGYLVYNSRVLGLKQPLGQAHACDVRVSCIRNV